MPSHTAAAIAAGSAVAASGFAAWAVRGRSASVFGPSVWRGPRDRPAVALTFDDGPSEGTPRILEMLCPARRAGHLLSVRGQCGAAARDRARGGGGGPRDRQPHSYPSDAALPAEARSSKTSSARARRPSRGTRASRPAGSARRSGRAGSDCAGRSGDCGLTGVMWTVIGYDWSLRADAVVARMVRRRLERRHPLPSRWTRASGEAGYRRDRGGRPAPGSHAAGPGLQIRNDWPTLMSEDLIQRVLKVIATSKRIPARNRDHR